MNIFALPEAHMRLISASVERYGSTMQAHSSVWHEKWRDRRSQGCLARITAALPLCQSARLMSLAHNFRTGAFARKSFNCSVR